MQPIIVATARTFKMLMAIQRLINLLGMMTNEVIPGSRTRLISTKRISKTTWGVGYTFQELWSSCCILIEQVVSGNKLFVRTRQPICVVLK